MNGLMRYFLFILSLSPFLHAEPRTWTRSADNKAIEAEYISADPTAETVTIKNTDGKTFTLALNILSEEDQKWVDLQLNPPPKKDIASRSESFFTDGFGAKRWTVRYPAGVSPEDYSKSPLCILYNASGDPTPIVRSVSTGADELGWIVIAVHAYSNTRAKENRQQLEEHCKKILADIQKNVPHDPNKVVFGGFSGAGWWSFVSAASFYKKTAGIISFGGWMSKEYDAPYPRKMTVAMVNGERDKNAIAWEERDGEFLRKKKKAKVKTFHFPGGHVIPGKETSHTVLLWMHETAEF